MSFYFIAQIKIRDMREYQKYLDRSEMIFNKYRGKYLSVDPDPEVLEGSWDYSRTVLIRFDSKSEFEDWYHSEEYREILAYRLQAADCDTILIKGKE